MCSALARGKKDKFLVSVSWRAPESSSTFAPDVHQHDVCRSCAIGFPGDFIWQMCLGLAAHLSPPVCCLQDKCHPQTIAVCQSRADGLGLKVLVSSEEDFKFDKDVSGILMQYPATDGAVHDYKVSHRCCHGIFAGGARHHIACIQQRSVYKGQHLV